MPLAYIMFIEGGLSPEHGLPPGVPGHPDQGLPGAGGRPGHLPAGPGSRWPGPGPDQGLPPVEGLKPGQLPSYPPPQVAPGMTLIMVRDQYGTWYYAQMPNSSAPPRPGPQPPRPDHGLPGHPGHPDQGLPGSPGHPDQGLPPTAGQPLPPTQPGQPGHPDQGLPPTAGQPLPPTQPGHPDQGFPPSAGQLPGAPGGPAPAPHRR